MGKYIITEELKAKIYLNREAGKSIGWISQRVGLSKGAIAWHCLRDGVESPKTRGKVITPRRPGAVEQRGNHVVRRFTAEEDAMLVRMAREGHGYTAIGRACTPPRRPNSIKGRLMTLARHDARKEEHIDV